jgi:hypothetical protein
VHWVVRLDNNPICTVPGNGARLTISTVSVGPGECELVDEARPLLSDAEELTIDQVVDAPRTDQSEDLFSPASCSQSSSFRSDEEMCATFDRPEVTIAPCAAPSAELRPTAVLEVGRRCSARKTTAR